MVDGSSFRRAGAEYMLSFGPDYDWCAVVTKAEPFTAFELEMSESNDDWNGTRVGFVLHGMEGRTQVQFYHRGWPEENCARAPARRKGHFH